jgi:repressor LexA
MARGRPVVSTLTDSQVRVLRELELWIARHGGSPTVRELAEQVGMAAPSVDEQLRRLQRNGYIKREPFKARSLTVLRSAESQPADLSRLVSVPIVGTVAAGFPIMAIENICGEVLIEESVVRSGSHFALKTSGKSMIGAGIQPGDIVIVRQQQIAEHRDIVVALLDGEATVKRLYYSGGTIELRPENDRFTPIVVGPNDDLRILGKVIAIRRLAGK